MTEHDERPCCQADQAIALPRLRLTPKRGPRRIERPLPPRRIQLMRNSKRHGFVVGVEEQQKVRVLSALSFAIANLRRQTIDEHAESTHPAAVLPILGHHPLAVRSEPDDVLVGVLGLGIAIEEGVTVEIRMLLAGAD